LSTHHIDNKLAVWDLGRTEPFEPCKELKVVMRPETAAHFEYTQINDYWRLLDVGLVCPQTQYFGNLNKTYLFPFSVFELKKNSERDVINLPPFVTHQLVVWTVKSQENNGPTKCD
jgi:hypothetical protein